MAHSGIPGWSYDILPFYEEMSKRIPQGGVFVEVGVFLGRSLAKMGELRPDLELWAIDPWADGESQGYTGPGEHRDEVNRHGGLFNAFLANMREHAPAVLDRTKVVRGTARDCTSERWGDFMPPGVVDMVFIDGAHDYENVKADIATFAPYVRQGGIISGHDYNPEWDWKVHGKDDGRAGVILATKEAFGEVNLGGHPPSTQWPDGYRTCWWVVKQ